MPNCAQRTRLCSRKWGSRSGAPPCLSARMQRPSSRPERVCARAAQAQALAVLRMENEALHGAVISMRDDSRRISVGDEDDSPGGRNRRISVEEAAGVLALEEARAGARRKEEEQAAIKVQAIARGKLTRDELVQRESATQMGAEAMLRIFSEQFASHNNIDD